MSIVLRYYIALTEVDIELKSVLTNTVLTTIQFITVNHVRTLSNTFEAYVDIDSFGSILERSHDQLTRFERFSKIRILENRESFARNLNFPPSQSTVLHRDMPMKRCMNALIDAK